MPRGYSSTPGEFWGAYDDDIMQEAYERIKDQKDKCEAAVELKLFLESDQQILSQPATRGYAFAVDTLETWLLPNEWNALAWILPVPGLGVAANVKNASVTAERIMTEVAVYYEAQKAGRALKTFVDSRGWTTEQVQQRQDAISIEIGGLLRDIEDAKSDMRVEVARFDVELKLAERGCLKPARLRPESCDESLRQREAAAREAEYRYHNRHKELAEQIVLLAAERRDLDTYRRPLAEGNCDALKQQPAPPSVPTAWDQVCRTKEWKIILGYGILHVYKKQHPWVVPTIYVINDWILRPDGTEFILEKREDSALVRVLEGAVTLTAPDGRTVSVAAGEQLSLMDGEFSNLALDSVRRVGGIPFAELRLDSGVPEPYAVSELRAADGALPEGWLWQEPNKNLDGPGDATLNVIDEETLRIAVPNENDFGGSRADAPRLLHKVTGDFDLESEMLLQCEGLHMAVSEFVLFTPDTPLGYLQGQINAGFLGAHYYMPGGGWAHWQNENILGVVNRAIPDVAAAPDEPIRVKLSRRGDQFKTYWSTDGGESWTLSSRRVLALPETLWTGWLFKRMAWDGLNDERAITTLRDVRLSTGPLTSMMEDEWDVVGHRGTVIPLGAEIVMTQDGTEGSYAQAYSPWTIDGDFDLTVGFDAAAMEPQPEQERYIHVAVTTNDEANHAYVRNALTPDWHRYDADMAINQGWYRYHYEDTAESSGRVRLVREEGVLSGYIWKDGDWVLVADWQDGFADAVYLDLRYQWKSPVAAPQSVTFTIERLETPEGLFFGEVEEPVSSAAPAVEEAEAAATPQPAQAAVFPVLTGDQRLEAGALFDDFSSEALGWSVRESESAATGYEDGKYAMLVKQPGFWVLSKVPGDFPHTVIEFDAAVALGSAGGMYGVICHYRDPDNYDMVGVDPETGGVTVGRLVEGVFVALSGEAGGEDGQTSKGLARAVSADNHVRVGCFDDRLELSVGGVSEGVWGLDPPGSPGSAALYVLGFDPLGENGYKALFDNVSVWSETPAP